MRLLIDLMFSWGETQGNLAKETAEYLSHPSSPYSTSLLFLFLLASTLRVPYPSPLLALIQPSKKDNKNRKHLTRLPPRPRYIRILSCQSSSTCVSLLIDSIPTQPKKKEKENTKPLIAPAQKTKLAKSTA